MSDVVKRITELLSNCSSLHDSFDEVCQNVETLKKLEKAS